MSSPLHQRTHGVVRDRSNRDAFVWGFIVHALGSNPTRPLSQISRMVDDACRAMEKEGIQGSAFGGSMDASAMRETIASQLLKINQDEAEKQGQARHDFDATAYKAEGDLGVQRHAATLKEFDQSGEAYV